MAEKDFKIGVLIKDVVCYNQNVNEALVGFQDTFVDPATDDWKEGIQFADVAEGINQVVDKMKEASMECEGKPLVIPAPEGTVGNVITVLLRAVGINIFDTNLQG